MFYDLLVPIDPDDPEIAAQVLEVARGLARSNNVSLTVLSVEPNTAPDTAPNSGEPRSDPRGRLENFLAQNGGLGDIKGVLQVDGSLFPAIRSAAKALGVDLLLLGSRDPDFTRRLIGAEAGETARFGDLTIDRRARRVYRDGREVNLGPTEFRLLDCLLRNPGRAFTREELLGVVWGSDGNVEPRTVDVHVARLRKALNHEHQDDPIRTVRAVGYEWDPQFGG